MVFLPPQTGKSEIVSRSFPAWMLGVNPNARIILASYSADLATSFNRDCQKIMTSQQYAEIFPNTRINNKRVVTTSEWKRTANFFEVIEKRGYLFSVGVGGSTTGRAADILIIDDPIKDYVDACSAVMRQRRIDWFNTVAQTRLSKDGHIILMHTRWHETDLAGYLLKAQEMDEGSTQWEVISIPAAGNPGAKYRHVKDVREKDDPLWPEFKGDRAHIQKVKTDVGERAWSSLYQQEPKVQGGNIIKEEWIKLYTELPFKLQNLQPGNMIQSWDLQFKKTGTSFTVGMTIAKYGEDFYLLAIWRKKADIIDTQTAMLDMAKAFPMCHTVLVEDKANGPAILTLLKNKINGMIPVLPELSKDERLHIIAPIFEAGHVFIPANHPETKEIINELTTFPASENDDIVDAFSQGLTHFYEQSGIRHLEATSRW